MSPDYIVGLYRKHAAALARVREDQRRLYAIRGDTHLERSFPPYRLISAALGALGIPAHWKRRLKPQLDDLESEVTYLLVNKNLIELVAVIVLLSFGTGRLAGLDMLWSRRAKRPERS